MEYSSQCNQFADFNVHTVRFDFRIRAFGYVDSHELETCKCLVLCESGVPAQALDITTYIHIWSYFLHKYPINIFAIKNFFVDFKWFIGYNVSR